jgi:hypothetical protein
MLHSFEGRLYNMARANQKLEVFKLDRNTCADVDVWPVAARGPTPEGKWDGVTEELLVHLPYPRRRPRHEEN